MSRLAIIPARGGSKRIPRKNVKSFLGKPIISYSIETAIKSNLFDDVVVSTDDSEIASISKDYGASVPFFRSSKNSNDYATLADVIQEVLLNLKGLEKEYDEVCCILPTAPFISSRLLERSYKKLNPFTSVFPVIEFSFPIQRSLQINDESVTMVSPEYMNTRSQDLPKRYHDAGQFYWLKVKTFLEEKLLYTKKSTSVIISELEAQDIDTITDWKLAELKYHLLNEISRKI